MKFITSLLAIATIVTLVRLIIFRITYPEIWVIALEQFVVVLIVFILVTCIYWLVRRKK